MELFKTSPFSAALSGAAVFYQSICKFDQNVLYLRYSQQSHCKDYQESQWQFGCFFRDLPLRCSGQRKTGNIGLGSLEVDAITGGWEGEHINLSLFDFGHAEAGAEIKNRNVNFGALASIWSPSFSFSIGKFSIDIGAEVGAIGVGFKKVSNGFSFSGAYGFGGSLTFSWND